MGCDIHLHLEYHTTPPGRLRRAEAQRTKPLYPRPIIANRFYIPRQYALFAALAGVRNSDDRPVLFAPRGLPNDVSQEIFHQFYMEVFPMETPANYLQMGWKWCRPEEAQKLADKYGTKFEKRGSRRFIADEFLHNPSHLYLSEINQALRHASFDQAHLSPEFLLVLGGMKFIDRKYGDRCSRIVFWFDS